MTMKYMETKLLGKHKKHLKACEKTIGITFRKKILLLEALTHKSHAGKLPEKSAFYNERLEFLGDSVLGMVITEYLFKKYPEKNEGILTTIKSKLIRRETLAKLSHKISLGELLFLGNNEKKMSAEKNPSILSNALEAVIGAYFLDSNLKKTRKFILSLFEELLTKELQELPVFEYKNKLQEYTQSRYGKSPHYRIISSEGPEHNKVFTSEVLLDQNVLGSGTGKSKKEAETEAAKKALKHLKEKNRK